MLGFSIVRCGFLILSILPSLTCSAQTTSVLPAGLDRSGYHQIPVADIPESNLKKGNGNGKQAEIKDPFIAANYTCSITPQHHGHWIESKESRIWQLKIRSKGAYGIALVLSGIRLNAEERLYVYNEYSVKGPYTTNTIPASGILPVSFLKGEEVVVEYHVPLHSAAGTFTIETVSHAYLDPFYAPDLSQTKSKAQGCYACLEGDSLQQAKRSVVKIIAHREDGSLLCTGTLINNTAGNKRPYVITAQHCIGSAADAARSIFIFGYDDLCNSAATDEAHQLTGATLLSSSYEHDLTLVELTQRPPLAYRPYYAGWNLSPSAPGQVLSIHHAGGRPKKVSASGAGVMSGNFSDDPSRAPGAFWKVKKWDTGITEGGSSGAPLFNSDYQVIGTLTGGSAQCNFPYNDYFQKLSASVQASGLKQWLDPAGLNVMAVPGLDPFKNIPNLPDESRYTISFYPNPATSSVISKSDFALPETFNVRIFDLQGRQQAIRYHVIDNNIILDISALNTGMYIVRIIAQKNTFTARVMKTD